MLLSVNAIHKEFAGEVVLESCTFRLDRHEKVALVGRNGAGKTTLIKIITGGMQHDGGSVQWARGATFGYLSQVSLPNTNQTVLEVATEAREKLVKMQQRLRELESQMADHATEDDLEEYSRLQEHFHSEGGYAVENDLKFVLKRLGFEEEEWSKPVSALSGGEKTRLALAKLLLEEPDLLILDEPTNHLDLDAIEWLESWIRGYGGAVLIVSHDRTFLQSVAERVLEIREGTVDAYPGPFDKYLKLRKEADELLAKNADRQAAEMAKLDEFVRRFINSQRTAQARGRLKMLERMEAQRIVPHREDKQMKAGFKVTKRAGDVVLDCKKLSMAFGTQELFQNLDWTVKWGDRWGVIGSNGAGKSTLMRVALGDLEAVAGEAKLGSNVELGWFRQDASFLNPDMSPLETMHYELGMDQAQARNLLGRFLISGDDAMRPIKTLSGGEKGKVALAAITSMHPNVLVLDEPTNHLDIASREALADVLNEYNGTLILVSHDRWLLEQVTKQTLELRPDGATQYQGNYLEYRAWKAKGASQTKPAVAPKDAPKQTPMLSPRELSKEIARMQKEVSGLEDEITKLETEMEAHERLLARPQAGDDLVAMSVKHGELRSAIEDRLNRWTELGGKIEEYKNLTNNGDAIGISFR
ncbi:MAG: ABC-F family ATP-binding cassette domain-containing protein [Fimbriimonadaceae bacterium]|nr:ABC-F family ATP-binding cassette domain-containing protein [Fimbriimonadaceae bacterium]